MTSASPSVNVEPEALTHLVTDLFTRAGVSEAQARVWASSLVEANLRGVDSHGVQRVPRYLELLRLGQINRQPDMRVLYEDGALALLDADRAPGPIGMNMAMEVAIRRAQSVRIGWCIARDITHAGMIGQFARMATDRGFIGIAMTASVPLMAYHGSRDALVSTNPLAIAVPAKGRNPLVLDMATSVVALGKVIAAAKAGKAIPGDWGLAEDGTPTTDPALVKTLLPMAGPKGAGLSLMIEILASIAADNPVLAPAIKGAKGTRMNGVAIAIDVGGISVERSFPEKVADLAKIISAQPTALGFDKLLMPGERSETIRRERLEKGIKIPQVTWKEISEAASTSGVMLPVLSG